MARERDRVGLGWRTELTTTILANLDAIDVVEVLADAHHDARGLALLARRVPVALHGTGLGLASVAPLDTRRLDRLARLVGTVEPIAWSEHLAFVRGGGHEIGGLAAPPRNAATVEAAVRNLDDARAVVGALPLVENVATVIAPPRSSLDEPAWISQIVRGAGCGLLLDLYNLHANAVNFGFSAQRALDLLPLDAVRMVHVAGGRWVTAEHTGDRRLLDDHRHEIPDAVLALLTQLAACAPQPLDVILERDGDYPPVAEIRAELGRVRDALARGRAARDGGRL